MNASTPSASSEDNQAVLALLDKKERSKLIENFFKEELELPGYQVKLAVKILLPSLEKIFLGTISREAKNINTALRERFSQYDSMAMSIGKWLGHKLEPSLTKKDALDSLSKKPKEMAEEDWQALSDQTRVWITELSELDLINLTLGDLEARIRLVIDQPRNFKELPPSFWLRPHNCFIPMTGRKKHMDYLSAFCDSDNIFAWTLLTGDGGIGKTRLAIEFAKQQKERGWDAGFLSQDHLQSLVTHPEFQNWHPLMPTLIVVDYAAEKHENLKRLLVRCQENSLTDSIRLRLLLMERHGRKEDGWMKELLMAGDGAVRDDIHLALNPTLKVEVPENENKTTALEMILSQTFERWQELSGKTPPSLPEFDENLFNHLQKQTQMRPLFIQMAGIHACETGNTIGLAQWTIDTLLSKAVERERDYLRKNCPTTIPINCLERAVAILSFTGPVKVYSTNWMRLLKDDSHACGFSGCEPGVVCNVAKNLLGSSDGNISPIGPNIIAEAFSVLIIKENEYQIQNLLNKIISLSGKESWSRLLRSVIDLYFISSLSCIETWVIELIPKRPANELIKVEKLISNQSVAQNRLRIIIYECLLLLSKLLKNNDSANSERARILLNYSICIGNAGKWKEALNAVLKAIKLYEKLVDKNPDAFEPDLAKSYLNLGNRYYELGKRHEAFNAAFNSVELYEKLVGKNPDVFESDLAGAYNNLGNRYSDLGKPQEALSSLVKAVDLFIKLANKNPNAFEPDLAMSYLNLGDIHLNLGNQEESLNVALKAVKLFKKLADKNPDAFEYKLAVSYNNLGNSYRYLGEHKDELNAALKAVEIYKKLADKNPDTFEVQLAGSYNNLGNSYVAVGKRPEAISETKKAVKIYENLSGRNPGFFEPDLAMSYNNLGLMYSAIGKPKDALKAIIRALEIREKLADENPDVFEPGLALCYGSKGILLGESGDISGAAESFLQGIHKLKRLFLTESISHVRVMSQLCNDYIKACKNSKMEPDMKAISGVMEVLKSLNK